MKIFACSDIHLDNMPVKERSIEAASLPAGDEIDLLVIAGDLGRVRQQSFKSAVRALCRTYDHVVFVAGNHEFYGSRSSLVLRILSILAEQEENFHWLEHRCIEIDGCQFVGTTLWFETEVPLPLITDFSLIKHESTWFFERNERARAFLEKQMTNESIVVTHHCPVRRFADRMKPVTGMDVADYYCSPSSERMIETFRPRLWIHGHIHRFHDETVGATRVLCNPAGYPGEQTGYNGQLILTL